jgi:hypothetical protein
MARIKQNMEFLIGYEVPPFAKYGPDIAAMQASSARVVAAVGDASDSQLPYCRAAFAVAERLGTQPAACPGDDGGFGAVPRRSPAKLHEVLSRP